jgi:molybdate transport repressor ModE-like protein
VTLSPHVPDLTALEVLHAVARTGGLGAAARELGLTQQAVSSRLRTVERLVGVALLQRSHTGTRLTAAGELLDDRAGRVLAAAAFLDTAIAQLRGQRDAHLDVAASYTVAEYLLPAWLVSLRAELTDRWDLDLVVLNSRQVADHVLAGRAQLGFVESPDIPHGLDTVVVAHDELVVVVRPEHPWARLRRPLEVAELVDTPLVCRETGSGARRVLDRAVAAATGGAATVTPSMALSALTAVHHAVLAGAGPGVLSDLAVRDDLACGRLVRIDVTGLCLRREVYGVWNTGPIPAGPARALLRIARDGTAPDNTARA